MPDTPTFGRYAEIPYDRMTPEQQEGYRSLVETRLLGHAAGGIHEVVSLDRFRSRPVQLMLPFRMRRERA